MKNAFTRKAKCTARMISTGKNLHRLYVLRMTTKYTNVGKEKSRRIFIYIFILSDEKFFCPKTCKDDTFPFAKVGFMNFFSRI